MIEKSIFTWLKDTLREEYLLGTRYPQLYGNYGSKIFSYLDGLQDPNLEFVKNLKKEYWTISPRPSNEPLPEEKTFIWDTRPDEIRIIIPVSQTTVITVEKLILVSTRIPNAVYFSDKPAIPDDGGVVYYPPETDYVPDYIMLKFLVADTEPLPISFTIREIFLVIKDFK